MAERSGADNPLDQLRLSLMQEVLPVGLAMIERARDGGPAKVAEAFTAGSQDPIADLRQEGEPAARTVREQLDQVSPGLGNPVMPVTVSVEETEPIDVQEQPEGSANHATASSQATAAHQPTAPDERRELLETLYRIEARLALLRSELKTVNAAT